MTRGTRIGIVSAVAGALGIGLLLQRQVVSHRWDPPTEEGWSAVIAGVEGHPVCAYPDDRLVSAVADLESDPTDIGDRTLDALDQLLAWYRGFEGVDGADPAMATGWVRLGRTAIDTGDPELTAAAMRLGWALRRCGALDVAMPGFDIAAQALEASPALALGVHPRYWPNDADILAALRAEAAVDPRGTDRAYRRAFWADRLRNPTGLVLRFREGELPPSEGLRESAAHIRATVDAMSAVVAAYQRAIGRSPPGGYPPIPRHQRPRETAVDWSTRR